MYYRMMDPSGGDWMFDLIMNVLSIVLLAVIVAVIIKLINSGAPAIHRTHHELRPLDIAKARYAKGEIDKDEFDQIKKDLD